MAGRRKIPINVQEQYRDVHRSNAEKEARAEMEAAIDVPFTDIKPPRYLTDKKLRKKFRGIASMLQSVSEQLCTELDADTLARYVMVESDYRFYQSKVVELQNEPDSDSAELERYERLKNTAFKQVESLSSKLLLEPASRARAALAKQEAPKENKFARFDASGSD